MSVPDKYTMAVKVLSDVKSRKKSFKRAMVAISDSVDAKDQRAVYALVSNTLKHRQAIERMRKVCIKQSDLGHLDDTLLEVAIGKVMFERRTSISNIPYNVPEFKVPFDLRKSLKDLKDTAKTPEVHKLSHVYLRINNLNSSRKETIQYLSDKGFEELKTDDATFSQFIETCKRLRKNQFIKDFHLPKNLLVFHSAASSRLLELDLYKEGKIFIQDKASVMAICCLPLKKNMNILDVCCAPGTKTAVIASKLKNKANIISIDRDSERMKEMKSLMHKLGVTCSTMMEADFIDLVKNEPDKISFDGQIDLLLLDPSCSGTGRPDMASKNFDGERIGKLSGFQILLLKAALSLKPKTILYSTCSLNTAENERVVDLALKESENGCFYQVMDPFPEWPRRGDESYEFGNKCVRSHSFFLTRGFFFCYLCLKETE